MKTFARESIRWQASAIDEFHATTTPFVPWIASFCSNSMRFLGRLQELNH